MNGNPLRDILGPVPRAINSDVLRLCMPGQIFGGSSFECFDIIVVECSRVACFDLRDLFLANKVPERWQECLPGALDAGHRCADAHVALQS